MYSAVANGLGIAIGFWILRHKNGAQDFGTRLTPRKRLKHVIPRKQRSGFPRAAQTPRKRLKLGLGELTAAVVFRGPIEGTAACATQRSYGFSWFCVEERRRSVGAIDDARKATEAEHGPQSLAWRFGYVLCQLGVLSLGDISRCHDFEICARGKRAEKKLALRRDTKGLRMSYCRRYFLRSPQPCLLSPLATPLSIDPSIRMSADFFMGLLRPWETAWY